MLRQYSLVGLMAVILAIFPINTVGADAAQGPTFWTKAVPNNVYLGVTSTVTLEFHVSYKILPMDVLITVGNQWVLSNPETHLVALAPTSGSVGPRTCQENTCQWIWRTDEPGHFDVVMEAIVPTTAGVYEVGRMEINDLSFPVNLTVREWQRNYLPYVE